MSLSLTLTLDNGVHERSYSNLYEPRKVFEGFRPTPEKGRRKRCGLKLMVFCTM